MINVNSAAELTQALNNARGGEVIELASGNYETLDLRGKSDGTYHFDPPITIRSADPEDQAVFSGMTLNGVIGINIEGVTFEYDAQAGAATNEKFTTIVGSQNVSITDSTFNGDLAEGVDEVSDGYATGIGLHVDGSSDVDISGNDFSSFLRGATFWRSDGLTLTENHVHAMRSDGFNFADVDNVLIEGNHFESFIGSLDSSDHRDFIQFWTTSTTSPSTNVVIRENLLDVGDGDWTQSIFIRNELVDQGHAGQEFFYSNFLIEDNIIRNTHQHGITVGEVDGLVIRNNTVVEGQGDNTSGTTPRINVSEDALNVTITQNIAHDIMGPNGASISQNLLIDPDDFEALQELFANPLDASLSPREALMILDGAVQVGSPLLHRAPEGETVGLISQDSGAGLNMAHVTLDITDLVGSAGRLGVEDIQQVTWNLGDGSEVTGSEITYGYAAGGLYNVTAEIQLTSGEIITGQRLVRVEDPIAHLGQFNSASDLEDYDLSGSVTVQEGQGLSLDGGSLRFDADESYIDNTAYTVSADFRLEEGDDGGRLINFTGSFHLQVTGNTVAAAVITDQDVAWVNAGNLDLQDGEWHRLSLSFSSESGVATLMLNGQEIGEVTGLEGHVQSGNASQDFIIGSPSGGFTGDINNVTFLRGAAEEQTLDAVITQGGSALVQETAIITPSSLSDLPELAEAAVTLEPSVIDVNTITVDNTADLQAALNAATGGETIYLENGTYDRVVLRDLATFSDQVTIASADPENQAFLSFLYLEGVSNLVFDAVTLGGAEAGRTPVQVHDSANITLNNILFQGDSTEDRSLGLLVRESNGITVQESTFDGYDRAVLVRTSDDINIQGNTVSQTSRDVISFVDSVDINVTNNRFDDILTERGQSFVRIDNVGIEAGNGGVVISDNVLDATGHTNISDIVFDSAPEDSLQQILVHDNTFLTGGGSDVPSSEANFQMVSHQTTRHDAPDGDSIWEMFQTNEEEEFVFDPATSGTLTARALVTPNAEVTDSRAQAEPAPEYESNAFWG